jgi:hypothetical protein
MWYLVGTCENVHDTSTKVGQSYVDLREMNEHSSVESYITYFQSRNMRWLKYASGMKEGVCLQNFGYKSSWLYLIKEVYILWSQRYTVFPYQNDIESILSHFMFQCFSCVGSLSWQDDADKRSGAQ